MPTMEYLLYRNPVPFSPSAENHFLMNVAEVLEQQLSKHERQDDRGIQCATRTRNRGRRNGPFSRHIGYMCLENGTRNRCVSIIAIFILSFSPLRNSCRACTIRYDTIRTRHCSRWPCLLHNGYPAFRSLNCRRWLSRRPGRMFFLKERAETRN